MPLSAALAVPLTIVCLTAGGLIHRFWCRRRAEAECAARLPIGDGGVVLGAAPIALDAGSGSPAVLLLHGGGDTPQTLRYLAAHLHARGFTVRAPLLPGHGRTLRAFGGVSADAWIAAARVELDALTATHQWTGVVGLSMGGALAVRLAAERPTISALVVIAPYLDMPPLVRYAARTTALWGPLVPYVRAGHRRRPSILNERERVRSRAYGYFTPIALRALAETVQAGVDALPRVQVPTLMLQSREDNRINPLAASRVFARLGTPRKELVWVRGAHVLTVDEDRKLVTERVAAWLEGHGAPVGK